MNHDQFTFSRDVLSKSYTQPFAIHTYDDGFSIIDSTSFVCFDLIYQKAIAEIGKKNEHLIQQGKAILQATSKDLDKR
jgi:hypothetical protein